MPSTTPDLSTVTGGGSSLGAAGGWRSAAAAPPFASLKVDGARPPRGRGGKSAARARSGFGQASSKVAGGGSLGSTAGGAAAGAGPGAAMDGSVPRAWARSRSFRDDEENNRLRRGLTAGAASTGSAAAGTSLRTRSRDAVSSCHGGNDGAAGSAWPAISG